MQLSDDLFADQGPAFSPQPDRLEVVAGKVVATTNKPSAAQKRFNTLMARVEAEKSLGQTLRHALETHGPAHGQAMQRCLQESQQLCKAMVLHLDQCIQAARPPKGLTVNQKRQAIGLVLSLSEQLPPTLDPEVEAVLARYTETDDTAAVSDDEAAQMAQAQALLSGLVGDDFAQGRTFDSPEAMLEALLAHERDKAQAQAEKRDAKRAARKAQKGPSARDLAQAQEKLDAHTALRTVYRQLASALHPDREPDPVLRARKNALMSEVNAANERKDLSALLRIQLEAEMVDASKAALVSQDRLKAMCNVLNEQVKALEQDNQQLRMSMEFEFGYAAFGPFREDAWQSALQEARDAMESDIAHMRADLEQVQDDKLLKAWLKEQSRALKATRRYEADAFAMDDLLFDLMRRR